MLTFNIHESHILVGKYSFFIGNISFILLPTVSLRTETFLIDLLGNACSQLKDTSTFLILAAVFAYLTYNYLTYQTRAVKKDNFNHYICLQYINQFNLAIKFEQDDQDLGKPSPFMSKFIHQKTRF